MNKWYQSMSVRLAIVLVVVTAMGAAVTRPVQAAEIDDDGQVGKDEVINDDLFLGGDETVVIDGTVNGMLFTAGNTVEINGTINGDVVAFGSVVTISDTGKVSGNLFTGAQTINLEGEVTGSTFAGSAAMNVKENASVGNNLYFGGYSLTTEKGSKIGKDLLVGMYQAILNGDVERDARVSGGAVEVRGMIGRNAVFNVDAPGGEKPVMYMPSNAGPALPAAIDSGLRIDPAAKIGGKLTYTSPAVQTNTIKAEPSGGIVHLTPIPQETSEAAPVSPAATTAAAWGKGLLDLLRNMVTLLLLGAVALWLAPNFYQDTVAHAKTRTLPSAGVGFLSILAGYTGAFLAFLVLIAIVLFFSVVTLGGLSGTVFGVGFFGLGILVTVFTLAVSYGSKLVIALLVGQWVMSRLAPAAPGQRWWGLFIGVAIFAILRAIPFIGWIFGLVVTLIGLGAIYFAIMAKRQAGTAAEITAA
ncbi:MAG: polymer-forming cytoskeletal protein [Anaerolineaceae bacterium]